MLCLLEIFHDDLMVDVHNTDQDAIIKSISSQVVNGTILYPFVNGRTLYDRYFELFGEQGKPYLSVADTQHLLGGTEQGVFQVFEWVTGPFGVLRSRGNRLIPPETTIRLRHCADPSCAAVHNVALSTDTEADINKHRDSIHKILERGAENEGPWLEFVRKISSNYTSVFRDWALDPIVLLIGDALTDGELRAMLDWLFENTDDYLRQVSREAGVSKADGIKTVDLTRPQLMQLMLTCEDEPIVRALDNLTRTGIIDVPVGEVRQAVINRVNFGRHGLFAELGRFGIRVRGSKTSIAPLRARSLVEKMYRMGDAGDRQELEWQLRAQPGDSLEAKLEDYLRTKPLRKSLGSLIVARKSNVVVASETLGLEDSAYEGDEDLLSAILWKLGFAIDDRDEPHGPFWKLHDRMIQEARRGLTGDDATAQAEIETLAGGYFRQLERILEDSLVYTTWALTNDHYSSAKPFVFRPSVDRAEAVKVLTQRKDDDKRLRLVYDDRNVTLFPLVFGFERLAIRLEEFEGRSSEFERATQEFPDWTESQSLERFPFCHKVPFLDLMPECRVAIIRTLRGITERLKGVDVTDTRNYWVHARRTMANMEQLEEVLESVRAAVQQIEDSGFARQLYVRVRDELDGDGRRTVTLANSSGREITFFRPSPFDWLHLPALGSGQYVMNSARFAEPSEALRFMVEVESPYSEMWANYPRRPRLDRSRSVVSQTEMPFAG